MTEKPDYQLLESLVLDLLSRLRQNYAYLPERRILGDSHIEYSHDQFGAKFKFYVVKNEKEKQNE